MIKIRPVEKSDFPMLIKLANNLDSINLATNRTRLSQQIDVSAWSFAGELCDYASGMYIFVAEADGVDVAGSSMIIAKHGTENRPHLFLEKAEDIFDGEAIGNPAKIEYLRLGKSTDGPTELGGLIVNPVMRGKRMGLGKAISFIRLIYIYQHKERFEKKLIAEMKPRLEADNESAFWNHFGREITGLKYREADLKSVSDKGFIERIFKSKKIYQCMLPDNVRRCIGSVGDDTLPAVAMLKKAGFEELNQVDPLDGGMYLGAKVDNLRLLKLVRPLKVAPVKSLPERTEKFLIGGYSVKASSWRGAYLEGVADSGKLLIQDANLKSSGFTEGDIVDTLAI